MLLGLGFAYAAVRLLPRLIPASQLDAMPFLRDLGLSAHTVAFATVAALLATVLFALAPSLRLKAGNMRLDLAEGGRGAARTVWARLGSKLVMVELATAVALLMGAGLLGKSLYTLLHVDTGFRANHLSSVIVDVPKSYKTDAQAMALERELLSHHRIFRER